MNQKVEKEKRSCWSVRNGVFELACGYESVQVLMYRQFMSLEFLVLSCFFDTVF